MQKSSKHAVFFIFLGIFATSACENNIFKHFKSFKPWICVELWNGFEWMWNLELRHMKISKLSKNFQFSLRTAKNQWFSSIFPSNIQIFKFFRIIWIINCAKQWKRRKLSEKLEISTQNCPKQDISLCSVIFLQNSNNPTFPLDSPAQCAVHAIVGKARMVRVDTVCRSGHRGVLGRCWKEIRVKRTRKWRKKGRKAMKHRN